MQNKFREFWVRKKPLFSCEIFSENPNLPGFYHVVEVEALEAKNAEINQLKMQLDMTNNNWPHEKKLHEQLKSANAEIERLKYYETQWQSIAGKASDKNLRENL